MVATNAKLEDAGTYECSITSEGPNGDFHKEVTTITVLVENIVTTTVGKTFTMECQSVNEVLGGSITTPSGEK